MKQILLKVLVAILIVKMGVGCATIINGTTQELQIQSSPDKAEIWVNGEQYGQTPATINLDRSNEYTVKIKKSGYQEYVVRVSQTTSGAFWGNCLLGGVIGMLIDGATGGCYELSPEFISVSLSKLDENSINEIELPASQFGKLQQIQFKNDDNKTEILINISPSK
jgi:hypothetical protein